MSVGGEVFCLFVCLCNMRVGVGNCHFMCIDYIVVISCVQECVLWYDGLL